MNVEAFVVSYDKANYHAPVPKGHNPESVVGIREERIENNIVRYLGEYRLGVKFDEIFYKKEKNLLTGELYLASGEEGPIRNIFRKAIKVREQKGLSVKREVAECLGFEKLEKQLLASQDNLLFIWVSPPGSKTEGFGDYSFAFIGQKGKDPKTGEEEVRVVPYRNILSQKEHRAYLRYFDRTAASFKSDIDFLSNPIVFSPTDSIKSPEDILVVIGETEKINTDWFGRLKQEVNPLIQRYIALVKRQASDEELTRVKYAIENYTLSLKKILSFPSRFTGTKSLLGGVHAELDTIIENWSKNAPPKASGSCGSSSNSTLSELHEEFNKKWEYHSGDCVVCGTKDVEVGPCSICKECEKKFDKQELAAL